MPVIILSASSCPEAQQSISTQACPPSGFATRSSQMHKHTSYTFEEFSSCARELISPVPQTLQMHKSTLLNRQLDPAEPRTLQQGHDAILS